MRHEKRALEMAKVEEEEMLRLGSPYRQETARYVSLFFNELVNAGKRFDLSREELKEEIRNNYKLETERVNDVAKSIWVLLAKAKDEDRLAVLYERATEKMKKRDADRKS